MTTRTQTAAARAAAERQKARPRGAVKAAAAGAGVDASVAAFVRAPGEDDDGYDPYSDRPADREALFEPDPWA